MTPKDQPPGVSRPYHYPHVESPPAMHYWQIPWPDAFHGNPMTPEDHLDALYALWRDGNLTLDRRASLAWAYTRLVAPGWRKDRADIEQFAADNT